MLANGHGVDGTTASPASIEAWLTLGRASRLDPRTTLRLLTEFGDAAALCTADEVLLRAHGLSDQAIAELHRPDRRLLEHDIDWLSSPCRHLLVWGAPVYPPLLATLDDAPPVLYAVGRLELLESPAVAIVGTRRPSATGRELATEFSAGLCGAGLAVVSGLALGIDAAAQAAALAAGGKTVAVLGCGIDRVYPRANRRLRDDIESAGLVLSEHPPGVPPLARHFPRRNRIISGLSLGVLVVEAARRSGSLITARLAAEQGRDVFAVPGSVRNPMSAGCHALLRQGATLVETLDDVLAELQPGLLGGAVSPRVARPRAPAVVTDQECQVLQALGYEPVAMDFLLQRTTLTPQDLCSILLTLEVTGRVAVRPGGLYERIGVAGA